MTVIALAACSTTAQEGSTTDGAAASTWTDPPQNLPGDIPPRFEAGDPLLGTLRFEEVADESGLIATQSDNETAPETNMTSGAAVADVDGDGDDDIFLPRVGKPNGLYLNDGAGHFTDVAAQAGVAGPMERFGSSTGAFADFDGDGRLDLFVAGASHGANQLLMNTGDGRFRREGAARGLVWPEAPSTVGNQIHGVTVADANNDGHMDLLVLHWNEEVIKGTAANEVVADAFGPFTSPFEGPTNCARAAALSDAGFPTSAGDIESRSALFLNDGSGHFHDATAELELPLDEIVAFTGVFADLDRDGWQDLTVTGDYCTSRVFRNIEGHRFEDVTGDLGVPPDENGMGSVVRDIDRDGILDWFITSISHPAPAGECVENAIVDVGCSGNRVFLGEADGGFVDATDELGLRDGGWGWGAAIEDFDNDGSLEVTMANGFESGDPIENSGAPREIIDFLTRFSEQSTRFWVYDGTIYRDAASAVGIDDRSIGHALVPFDMDGDGDLDLLIAPAGRTPLLYRNETPPGNAWLSISLVDPTNPGNRWGDGARIVVVPDPAGDSRTGWITTSGSYESQKPPVFHVGLGDHAGTVARIEVWWPDGDSPQVLTNVVPNNSLKIVRNTSEGT